MPEAIRLILIVLGVIFVVTGGYYRLQSARSGEQLDRSKEGWLILIAVRLLGLLTVLVTVVWLWKPAWFEWTSFSVAVEVRWIGVAGFACAIVWLLWMFHSLGRNLTDTVVTRRDAYFVDYGPYRFVRNPMYTGILILGISLGLALGTWLLPLAASFVFALLAVRTRTEEKYLIERFGDQYREYMERVGRFLPKWPF
jgi:protein-S-isoprenylcysteine O-methyltransferase Ste14